MVQSVPAVVIDNGSNTTRAGFALEEIPSLVYNSNYVVDASGRIIVGNDEIAKHPELDVIMLTDDGTFSNPENLAPNWRYAFENLDGGNGVDATETPLMVTEPTWNSSRAKAQMAQIAFEDLTVPLFSIVKTPLAQLYYMGRSSGLVIDIGSSVASVTPVLDGIIQLKSCFRSKYAGDFVDLHCLSSLLAKMNTNLTQPDYSRLLPKKFQQGVASGSFKLYYTSHDILRNFKQTMLHANGTPPGIAPTIMYHSLQPVHQHPPYYQLTDGSQIPYSDHDILPLVEAMFAPHAYKIPGVNVPEPALDKASTHGISNLILFALKNLESSFMSSMANDNQNSSANARFNEVLKQLLANVLITGGGSLVSGFSDRLCGDLSRSAPQVLPNYYALLSSYRQGLSPLRNHGSRGLNDALEKQFSAWLGAANLAAMLRENFGDESGTASIALDNWFISKSDYDELGEDLIVEKFK